jgi:hypothetical protein
MKRIRQVVLLALILAAPTTLRAQSVLLYPGQTLGPDESVWADGCNLAYQGDGNLVLYCGGAARWWTGTFDAPGNVAMQSDGNLVVYNASGGAPWHSKTHGHDGAYLTVEGENVVVRSPSGASKLWSGGMTPRWFPASAVSYYEAGMAAYNGGRVDQMLIHWHNYHHTPGSECHPYFAAVTSILQYYGNSIDYPQRPCSQ